MYYSQPRAPRDAERRLIDVAADIARIAIEQRRAYEALAHSEARTRAILRAIPDWMFLTTLDGVILDFHAQDASKLYATPAAFLGRAVRDVLPASVANALARPSPVPSPPTSRRRSSTRWTSAAARASSRPSSSPATATRS